MAQRTVALCDNKFIGIESIYTVIDGKQINVPDKLADLRSKSRRNELFCPCGCGSNLILVASENNLREQHFRLKNGEFNKDCQAVTEGKRSVDSKIILKCWLDDKLQDENIESRVPIADVSDTERRFEFTFLSAKYSIGVSYCHDRVNVSDTKLKLLAENSAGINLVQKLDGLWEEVSFCDNKLTEFVFANGVISYKGTAIKDLADEAKKRYEENQLAMKAAREAYEKEQRELAEKRRAEFLKQQEEIERRRAEEAERRRIEAEKSAEQRRIEEEQRKDEQIQAAIRESHYIEEQLNQQEKQVIDSHGVRWIKCEYCGLVATTSSFSSYGGPNHINLGTCYDCKKNNPAANIPIPVGIQDTDKKRWDKNICPQCGGRIVEKTGPYGKFLTCSNFPKCKYKPSRKW